MSFLLLQLLHRSPHQQGMKAKEIPPALAADELSWNHPQICIFAGKYAKYSFIFSQCPVAISISFPDTLRPSPKAAGTTPSSLLHATRYSPHRVSPASRRGYHGTFQPCAGVSVATVVFYIAGASHSILFLSPRRFHTACGKGPF